MEDVQSDILQQFMAITGVDEGVAVNLLDATNWILGDAVELHFASSNDMPAVSAAQPAAAQVAARTANAVVANAAAPAARGGGVASSASSAHAAAPAAAGGGASRNNDDLDEDGVRAPIPTKRERLYGDMGQPSRYAGCCR